MGTTQRGRAFEWHVRRYLIQRGAYVVRSAASKGICDLVALWKHEPAWLIQCKSGKQQISTTEWNELYSVASDCGCQPIIADRPSRGKIRFRRLDGLIERYARIRPAEQLDI